MINRYTALRRASLALIAAAVALGASAFSCNQTPPADTSGFDTLPPVGIGSSLVYVERTTHAAYFLDLGVPAPVVRPVPVGSDPTLVMARNGTSHEVLVLSRGTRGDTTTPPEDATLTAIPLDASASPRTYSLGSPFNAVAQTSDGRYAFVFFAAQQSLGRLLFNPNEIAIVDLAAPPDTTHMPASNPVLRTVRSFGGVPTGVVFSPPLNVNGTARTLAVVYSAAYVTLIDMDHLARSEITVRLTLPNDTRSIDPEQVLFDTDDPTLYIRAASSDDIYVLHLIAATPATATDNDYGPSINQLGVGHLPTDMALFGSGTGRRLLVVAPGSTEADVIDAPSNSVTPITLTAPADQILLYTGAAPHDPMASQRALLYAADQSTPTVSFLDLTDVEERRGRNLEPITMPLPIIGALPIVDQSVVLLQHAGGGSSPGLSLLDLTRRTASPIYAEVSLALATFGVDRQMLWVAPPLGNRIGYVDLTVFHPGEVLLDAPVQGIVPIAAGASGNSIVAVHNAVGGYITVLDAANPERATARSYRGFLLTDLLQRGAQ